MYMYLKILFVLYATLILMLYWVKEIVLSRDLIGRLLYHMPTTINRCACNSIRHRHTAAESRLTKMELHTTAIAATHCLNNTRNILGSRDVAIQRAKWSIERVVVKTLQSR